MKKEYMRYTRQGLDENMQPIGEIKETIAVSLIADVGKKIKEKATGILGSRVDIGPGAEEAGYEEVDDPDYTRVIKDIVKEAKDEF